jgi:hypothetical protein
MKCLKGGKNEEKIISFYRYRVVVFSGCDLCDRDSEDTENGKQAL